MKKRLAILLTAAAMVLSLAACGDRDNKNNGTTNNGATHNGTANNGTTSDGTANNSGGAHNSVGDDLKDAADDVGDAIGDAVDDAKDALDGGSANNSRARSANSTGFQRMLDNARVHDSDGVLTDGENSAW